MRSLSWLDAELKKLSAKDIESPGGVCLPTDKVIGTITDPDLKRLVILHKRLIGEHSQLEERMEMVQREGRPRHFDEASHDPATCKACCIGRESGQMMDRITLVEALMQSEIRGCLDNTGQIAMERFRHYKVLADWAIAVTQPQVGSQYGGPRGGFPGRVRVVGLGDISELLGFAPAGSRG